MKVLSIDFDYFLDTDIDTREDKFPDGDENITPIWDYWCNKYPEINIIGVIESYNKLVKYLKGLKNKPIFMYADSHGDIERIFDYFKEDEELLVENYDFHHDCYFGNNKDVTCANWVRILKQRFPQAEIIWHKREDSIVESLAGKFPYKMTLDDDYKGEYDIIFICYSPEWTPPHLRKYYEKLIKILEE